MSHQVENLDDIKAQYPGEYLLVIVTEEKQGKPFKGVLKVHDKERECVLDKLSSYTGEPVYFFYNGLPADTKTAYVL